MIIFIIFSDSEIDIFKCSYGHCLQKHLGLQITHIHIHSPKYSKLELILPQWRILITSIGRFSVGSSSMGCKNHGHAYWWISITLIALRLDRCGVRAHRNSVTWELARYSDSWTLPKTCWIKICYLTRTLGEFYVICRPGCWLIHKLRRWSQLTLLLPPSCPRTFQRAPFGTAESWWWLLCFHSSHLGKGHKLLLI